MRRITAVLGAALMILGVAGTGVTSEKGDEHYAKGLEYQARGLAKDALAAFQAGLKADPKDYRYLLAEGASLYSAGEYEKAEAKLKDMVALFPEDVKARLYLGYNYLKLDRYQAAKDQFQSILADDPKNARALTGLAKAQFASGDRFSAANSLEQALAVQPNNTAIEATLSRLREANQEALKQSERERQQRLAGQLDNAIAEASLISTRKRLPKDATEPAADRLSAAKKMVLYDILFQGEEPGTIRAFPRFPKNQ